MSEGKLVLLQIEVSKDTVKKLKQLALNNDVDSHRVYAAQILAELVDKMINQK